MGGVRRALRRLRSDPDRTTSSPSNLRSLASRPARYGAHPVAAPGRRIGRPGTRLQFDRALDALRARLSGRDRLVPIGVALLVLVGSLSGIAVSASPAGAVGNVVGGGSGPRLTVAGLDDSLGIDGGVGAVNGPAALDRLVAAAEDSATPSATFGPYLADGTLLKPIAVDTTVADASARLQTYAVRSGDTLTGIAHHFGLSMMTLWWANHLQAKDQLHIGQKLVIPPVDGLVITVKAGDTLDAIAAATGIAADAIFSYNGLTDRTLVLGQTIIIPGAQGKAIAEPRPVVARSVTSTRSASSSTGSVHPPTTYSGGRFAFPVPGGYISQYYHASHPAIDVAAPYGSRIVAGGAGKVIYAGWNDNGGGYQVWIAHGSGLYTGYYHMSAISVGVGQSVGRGTTIGHVGMSGWATGPHCHFEVWQGYPWANGSYRVNPLGYL